MSTMRTVQEYVAENGFESVLTVFDECEEDFDRLSEFADENNIEFESLLELAWLINDTIGSPRYDVIHVPEFNFKEVEETAKTVVSENDVTWSELIQAVSDETGVSEERVNVWLETARIERDEDSVITMFSLP